MTAVAVAVAVAELCHLLLKTSVTIREIVFGGANVPSINTLTTDVAHTRHVVFSVNRCHAHAVQVIIELNDQIFFSSIPRINLITHSAAIH